MLTGLAARLTFLASLNEQFVATDRLGSVLTVSDPERVCLVAVSEKRAANGKGLTEQILSVARASGSTLHRRTPTSRASGGNANCRRSRPAQQLVEPIVQRFKRRKRHRSPHPRNPLRFLRGDVCFHNVEVVLPNDF